jgi:hypothetical protein
LPALIVASATLIVVARTQRAENRRARLRDRAHLRDIKADRLRGLYEPLVAYSFLLERVASQKGASPTGESREQMNERHEAEMAEGKAKVEPVRARLILESGTGAVWKAYQATVSAWWTVHESVRLTMEEGLHVDQRAFNDTLARAQAAAEDLRTSALAQLAEFERPLAELEDSPKA